MTKQQVKRRIEKCIKRYASAVSRKSYALIPTSLTAGKLYEAHVLSLLLEHLHRDEGLRIVLVNTTFIPLKSAPGPINSLYPHFDLYRNGGKIAELWTDIEFLSLSYSTNSGTRSPNAGEYHELDIVVIESGVSGRPRHDQVWLGVECKNTDYKKSLLKEILGIRRELSFLSAPQSTRFQHWPRLTVPANPPSCLLVYSTDSAISNYSSPGTFFGIDFFHEAI
jgi:hypothetical protein